MKMHDKKIIQDISYEQYADLIHVIVHVPGIYISIMEVKI